MSANGPVTLEIFLKSGQTLKVTVDDASWAKSGQVITKFEWTFGNRKDRLRFIDVTQIAAIIEHT